MKSSKNILKILSSVALTVLAFEVSAGEQFTSGLGQDGFSGLPNTPTSVIQAGQMGVQLSPRVIGYPRHDGENLSSTIGLNQSFEVGGRIVGNTWTGSAYAPGNDVGLRDLSGSFKVNFSSLLDLRLPMDLAAGAVDIGGAATNFRSYYGVASYRSDKFMVSAGAAKAGSANVEKVLDGPFVNGSVALFPWLSANVETTSKRTWSGLKAEAQLLGLQTYLQVNQQMRGTDVTGNKPWWTFGFVIPLGGKDAVKPGIEGDGFAIKTTPIHESLTSASSLSPATLQAHESAAQEIAIGLKESHKTISKNSLTPHLANSQNNFNVDPLLKSLLDVGFEGVSVGWSTLNGIEDPQLVVSLTDTIFMKSQLDGLGVALGILSNSSWRGNYLLVIKRWGTPVQAVEGMGSCLASWLQRASDCSEKETLLITRNDPGSKLKGVSWVYQNELSDRLKPRIMLSPIYSYYVATEQGMFDYSLGLQMNPQVHLWDGAVFEFSHLTPLMQTTNFKADQIFGPSRIPHTTDRVMLHQMQKLPLGFSVRASAGRIFSGLYQGLQTELRYDQEKGPWAAGVTLSQWKSLIEGYTDTRHPTTGFVRYSVPNRAWNLEAQFGEYWFKDQGLTLMSRHVPGSTLLHDSCQTGAAI